MVDFDDPDEISRLGFATLHGTEIWIIALKHPTDPEKLKTLAVVGAESLATFLVDCLCAQYDKQPEAFAVLHYTGGIRG